MKNKKQIRFMSLYKPHHEAFVRFCAARAYGVMEADDLVNETIARVYEKLEALKSDKAFLSYMFSVAGNIIKNEIRKKKIVFFNNEIPGYFNIANNDNPEIKLDIEILYKALNILPNEQKEALILFEISGFSIKEITEMQNCSISSVKQRLRRGRQKLAELLNDKTICEGSVGSRSKVLYTLFF
ncbi:MAG: RNA polymerase sigma factor [Bacteroidota bacterium]|nr:RNA polymerase sigma factor [Bacteroidota bacterium]